MSSRARSSFAAGPSPELSAAARAALETAVGLGVMGLLRLRSEAPRLEAALARRGWEPLAAATHSASDAVDGVIRHLLQPPPFPPPPDPAAGGGDRPGADR